MFLLRSKKNVFPLRVFGYIGFREQDVFMYCFNILLSKHVFWVLNVISMELPILYFKGSQVEITKL